MDPLQVRQLSIEDGLALAMSPTPGAWHIEDGGQMPDEGYRAVVDAEGSLLGHCCFGEAARVTGAPSHPTVLDVSIGVRPGYAGRGWGASLGRAAIGLGDGVVRVSVGLEGTDDLIRDLDRALS